MKKTNLALIAFLLALYLFVQYNMTLRAWFHLQSDPNLNCKDRDTSQKTFIRGDYVVFRNFVAGNIYTFGKAIFQTCQE